MKLQIKEFAALVGVSVRTLHYYDEIGLLAPASVDAQSGYRYYDDASLARMQEILFYRELDFPLKEIAALLASPNYDKTQALAAQKELLILKRDRLNRLIAAIDSAEKGVIDMNAFDNSAFEAKRDAYAAEAKERWGASGAWQEHEMKTKDYSSEKWQTLSAEMAGIFADFAAAMTQGLAPESNDAQALAKRLQDHISANYYTCTNEILAYLGQMYTTDVRFRASLDRHAAGTADFVSAAIAHYCR